ncbi:MAG: hypothetical protein QOF52_1292 [Propionibacteriaceae bacterium]|jgi:hypothetical protein|nr:hypothetical protein [Propionibacteriaceae bacterium]
MGIYARRPWRFLGQVAADLFVIGWAVVWWLAGSFVHASIDAVAVPARETANITERLSNDLRDAGTEASQIPAIGDQLRRPFDSAADSVATLRASADQQVASIERLATTVGWLVFLIPVTVVVAIWLPRRLAFFFRARAAQRFIDSSADLDLFALRAMTTQPMHVLAKISDDPVRAWRTGDVAVINQLAEIELRRTGLRLPDHIRARERDIADQGLRGGSGWQKMKS